MHCIIIVAAITLERKAATITTKSKKNGTIPKDGKDRGGYVCILLYGLFNENLREDRMRLRKNE